MAVYEDDPRTKPKPAQRYGGSTSRGSALRGELLRPTVNVPGAKKDPRLPAAPKQQGPDRLDWDERLPRKPVQETPLHRELKEASPWIDAIIRELMRDGSPVTNMLEKRDRKGQSKPSFFEMWKIQRGSDRSFSRGPDKGITANPEGRIPPQTTGKFGPGHLPPYVPPPTPPSRGSFDEFVQRRQELLDRGLKA